jgi:hypothetical protein
MKLRNCNLVTGFVSAVLVLVLCAAPVSAADPVKLVIGGSGATPWAISHIKPGDSGSKTITIQNAGTSRGKLTIWVSNIINTEGTPAEFEPVPGTSGELGNYVTFTIVSSRISSNISMPVLITSLPQSAGDSQYIKVLSLARGETVSLNWVWSLPAGTSNIVQGDSLSFDIHYLLEQIVTPTPTYYPPPIIVPTTTNTLPATTTTVPPPTTTVPVPTTTLPAPSTTVPVPTTTLPLPTTTAPVPTTTAPPSTTSLPPTATDTTTLPPSTTPGPTGRILEIDLLGTITELTIGQDGSVQQTYDIQSPDGQVEFILRAGTRITTDNNLSLARIVIRRVAAPASLLDGLTLVQAYEIIAYDSNGRPVSVDFEPPVVLKLRYDADDLPDGTTAVYLMHYDETAAVWTKLEPPAGYMPLAGDVAALISHLSLYAVMAETPGLHSGTEITPCYIWVAGIILALAVILACWLVIIKRTKKKQGKRNGT